MGSAARPLAAFGALLLGMTAQPGLAVTPTPPGAALPAPVFEPCDLFDRNRVVRVEAECASYSVPENPDDPQGRRISLRLARIPARLPEPAADPIVLLAGGPGQAAIDAYVGSRAALHPGNRDRDILLVDQRGTGGSNRLACPWPEDAESGQSDAEDWRQAARDCLEAIGDRADPRYYTTSDYIRDLETVRAALGIDRVNLIGGSYGTRVALEYLRRHPQVVRSVVLDSPVPPELPLVQDHAVNLDAALAAIFARCATDAACAERYGDPLQLLARLRARLQGEAVAVRYRDARDFSEQEGLLSRDVLATIVRFYAYQPESMTLLPLLLAQTAAGNAAPLLAQFHALVRDVGDQLAHGMELSVLCAEDAPFLRPRADDADTVLGPALAEAVRAQCEIWPRGAMPPDFKQPVESDAPVLILSGEFDPVTPPRYGTQIARTLSRSRHLVAPGQGHSVMGRGCFPELIGQFYEGLDPAGLDAGCVDALGAMPFFLDYNGFAP
ncbi:MAG: alpha/beta fold hydrolase [Nevskiales bacterium]|nr:alpha/beta fold hydrolase [Nevskiales bacterium]